MGLCGSADAQTKKQAQGIKPVSGLENPVVNSDPNATVQPTEPGNPGDPNGCATCGDPNQSSFVSFPHLMWYNAFNNKKGFFVCDPRHWFGLGTDNTLENSYIRQALVDGRKCIGLGINSNTTYDLKDNFHFSNFQTLHVDGGGSHFGFNTYSKLENNTWSYPKLYTELNGNGLGASDIIQHSDGRISFNNLKATENAATDWQTVMTLTPDRKVGIGTGNPLSKLQVDGNLQIGAVTGSISEIFNTGNKNKLIFSGGEVKNANMGSENSDPIYMERYNDDADKSVLRINIGDDDGNDKVEFGYVKYDNTGWQQSAAIYANGEVWARKVKVTLDNYPDYVFQQGYKTRTLEETEAYIKANQHLPEMPSAAEVEKNGADLGELHKAMLKQLEELTLQVIALKKEVETLKSQK